MSGIRMFLGMDSTAPYFNNPLAPELALQSFNLNDTLSKIDMNIENKAYDSNWAFDRDVVEMFQLFRDGHTDYETVCTHGFTYIHNYPIVSIAPANGGLPEIYALVKNFASDIWEKPKLGAKIKKINGKAPADYLDEFIQTSPEDLPWVDPDARFNEMLYAYPEGTTRGRFARRNMWDGEDLKITWENGTETLVEYTVQLSPSMLDATGDKLLFSDSASLRDLCFLTDAELTKRDVEEEVEEFPKKYPRDLDVILPRAATDALYAPHGYPVPLAYSAEYAMATYPVPGDEEAVVLNISTLSEVNMSTSDFVQAISKFLTEQIASWQESGFKRLIIDVSNNGGGNAILVFEILRQLFPTKDDFLAINMHYSPLTWAYMNGINQGEVFELWRDLNMQDFSGMQDFLGPVVKEGTYFSKMWKQDYVQLGADTFNISLTHNHPQPFDADNITVISNSLCASACHSLVESLRIQGVRAFAYGGRAVANSPMQAVGGTKGGKVLSYDYVRSVTNATATNTNIIKAAGSPTAWNLPTLPVRMKYLTINSENKFREGNQTPLQFVYTAACNRFFMTASMLDDISEVWKKTREMAWGTDGTPTECVDYAPLSEQNSGGSDSTVSYDDEGVLMSGKNDSTGKIIWDHVMNNRES